MSTAAAAISLLRKLAVLVPLSIAAHGQCPNAGTWQPAGTSPSPLGLVWSLARWDPDGAGPRRAQIVCGGNFASAGPLAAPSVAALDPATKTWAPLGQGFEGTVRTLLVTSSGDLIAGGLLVRSGNLPLSGMARWNGFDWENLGGWINGPVSAILEEPNGDLVVAGSFRAAGGTPFNSIARWNGTTWSGFGTGLQGLSFPGFPPGPGLVSDVVQRSNGDLIVCGSFDDAGGVSVQNSAHWDGTAWNSINVGYRISTLCRLANDDVLLGGVETGVGYRVTRWDGSTFSLLGAPLPDSASRLFELDNGTILMASSRSGSSQLLTFDGSNWVPFHPATFGGMLTAIVDYAPDDLFVAQIGPRPVQRLQAGSLTPVADGIDGNILDACVRGQETWVGGTFRQLGDLAVEGLAVRSNGSWQMPPGGDVDGTVDRVLCMRNGDIVILGQFAQVGGGTQAPGFARWRPNGGWLAIPLPPLSSVLRTITELANGDLLVGGDFAEFARWDGQSWTVLPPLPAPALEIRDIVGLPNGNVAAAGRYIVGHPLSGSTVWQWDGLSWSPIGGGLPLSFEYGTNSMLLHSNGNLLVGGRYPRANSNTFDSLMVWDGISWSPAIGGPPETAVDLDELPNGDVLVTQVGNSFFGQQLQTPLRWDPAGVWSAQANFPVNTTEYASGLTVEADGTLLAYGNFGQVSGLPAAGLAELPPPCPADASALGTGCSGSAGQLSMRIEQLPWLGGELATQTSGMTTAVASLVVTVYGLGAPLSVPLTAAVPQAGPTCSIYTAPDFTTLSFPTGPEIRSSLQIPQSQALLGLNLSTQVVSVEFDSFGAITTAASSNALQVRVGAL
ncbi:MAG: hypothetical protein AB8H80_09555 [Planctomycetota bacterium]